MPITNYYWDVDTDNVFLEEDENGNTIAEYTQEPSLYGELIAQERDGQANFYNFDGQGSTRELTDQNQNVTDTYSYDAFGVEVARTGARSNPFGYKGALGYYTTGDTNDIYVRARTYEPTVGRWMSLDPLGFPQGINRYWYALNNPVLLADPSGTLCGCCCCPKDAAPSRIDPTSREAVDDMGNKRGFFEGLLNFQVDATLEFKPANSGDGRGCRVEWYECSDHAASLGQKAGEWFYAGPATLLAKPKWNWQDYYDGKLQYDCPGGTLRLYYGDSPNIPATRNAEVNIKFAFRIRKEAGCNCGDLIIHFTLNVKVRSAVSDVITYDPNPPVLKAGIDDRDRPTACTKDKLKAALRP